MKQRLAITGVHIVVYYGYNTFWTLYQILSILLFLKMNGGFSVIDIIALFLKKEKKTY